MFQRHSVASGRPLFAKSSDYQEIPSGCFLAFCAFFMSFAAVCLSHWTGVFFLSAICFAPNEVFCGAVPRPRTQPKKKNHSAQQTRRRKYCQKNVKTAAKAKVTGWTNPRSGTGSKFGPLPPHGRTRHRAVWGLSTALLDPSHNMARRLRVQEIPIAAMHWMQRKHPRATSGGTPQ